ncbi:MAG: hypothetical protein WCG01_00220 [bacterium]
MFKHNSRLFLLLAIFVILPKFVYAFGGPDYLPDGPHPRIWLSPEKITQLQAKVAANDVDWLAMKARADSFLTQSIQQNGNTLNPGGTDYGNMHYGYQGAGWWDAMNVLCLAYKMTGNVAYAAKARDLVDVMLTFDMSAMQIDSGYPSRYLPGALGIAYDWLYDYLDNTRKANMITLANSYYNWVSASGLYYGDSLYTSGNYHNGHLRGLGIQALAMYGDNSAAATQLSAIRSKISSTTIPLFQTGAFSGGQAVESYTSYGAEVYNFLIDLFYAEKSASGQDYLGSNANKIIDGIIYNTKPNRWQMTDFGTQSGSVNWVLDLGIVTRLVASNDITAAGKARYYIDNVGASPSPSIQRPASDDITRFLWNDNTVVPINYNITLPTYYREVGTEKIFSRSSWNTDAVWSMMSGGAGFFAPQSAKLAGHVTIQRGNDYLLVNAGQWRDSNVIFPGYSSSTGQVQTSVAANTFWIDDGGAYCKLPESTEYEGGQSHLGVNTILNYEGNSNFVYEKADLTSAYYCDKYLTPPKYRSLRLFYRNYISVGGGAIVVVYDITKQKSVDYNRRFQWYLTNVNAPVQSDSLVTTTAGSSKFHLKTVYPLNATTSISLISHPVIAPYKTFYNPRVEVTAPPSIDFNPLTVMLTTASGSTTPAITGIDTGAMIGSIIETSVPQVVLFSKQINQIIDPIASDESYQTIQQNAVTYTVAYSSTGNHLLVDMEPAIYDVYRDGVKIITAVVASPQGVLNFEANGGGAFQIVKTGEIPVSDIIAPSAPSGLIVL